MDEVTKEIRQMLLGNLIPKDKFLEVSPSKLVGVTFGINDGADQVFLLGVAKHTKYFQTDLKPNRIKEIGHKALMGVGRKVYLKSNENAETAICRYLVTRPIVVLFEVDEYGVKVETYTARGLLGLISELWIRKKFMKLMPKDLKPIPREEIYKKQREKDKARIEKEKAELDAKKAEEKVKQAEEEAKLAEAKAIEELRKAEEAASKAEEEAKAALEKARKAKEAARKKVAEYEEDFNYENEADERE